MSEQERIAALIKPTIEALGYQLWYVVVRHVGHRVVLTIFIDGISPITLDDCSRVSEALSPVLDVADPFSCGYQLEISSCGIERELFTIEHYRKYLGATIEVRLFAARLGKKVWRGELRTVSEDGLVIVEAGGSVMLKFADVSRAKLISV